MRVGDATARILHRRLPATALFAVAVVLGLGTAAVADVVHFTSGRSKTGIVLEETDTAIRLETAEGVVGIPWSVIESIDRGTAQENTAIRRAWAEAARDAQRARRARRAARRAARAAAGNQPAETQADANRRAEQVQRQIEEDRARVQQYQREQRDLPDRERNPDPIVVLPPVMRSDESGLHVTASVMNVTDQSYAGIVVEIALIEAIGTPLERITTVQTAAVPDLAPARVYHVAADFAFLPEVPVVPRVTVTAATAVP